LARGSKVIVMYTKIIGQLTKKIVTFSYQFVGRMPGGKKEENEGLIYSLGILGILERLTQSANQAAKKSPNRKV
jgi:hypothetical protein